MSYDYHCRAADRTWARSRRSGGLEETVSYIGSLDGSARREKFIFGLPNYGLLGPEAPGSGGAVVGVRAAQQVP